MNFINFTNHISRLFLVGTIVIVFIFCSKPASALTVSPATIDLELNPGESREIKIKLFNETAEILPVNATVETFKPRGEHGEADVLPPEIGDQAVNWLQFKAKQIVLPPQIAAELPALVSVPLGATPGGYYLAAVLSNPAGSGTVGVTSRIGVLILIKVKGEYQEKLSITDFGLRDQVKFYSALPVDFVLRLSNSGNIHLRPTGQVVIKNIFGQVVTASQINEAGGFVLPQSFREFSPSWSKDWPRSQSFLSAWQAELKTFALGRFSAQVQVEYGDSHSRLDSTPIFFWLIPWRTALAVIVLLVLFWLFHSRKR